MPLLSRKRLILAKTETTYGVDSVPTGSANAMLVKNLDVVPIQAELVSRDLIRPFYGNSEQLLATIFATASFEVEFVGSGTVGLAPAYDPLLKACGFTVAPVTAALTSITRMGSVATATLNAHGYAVGDKVVISGATQTEYNGTVTITAVTSNTFNYAVTGTPVSPATGAPVVTIRQDYTPVSSGFQSCTLYFNNDGVQHILRGCYGTFEVSLSVRQIPVFRFSFTGLYTQPTDVAQPAADFTRFMIPQIANTQNTPGFSLYGYSALLESSSMQLGNDVQYITLIGSESVRLLDRRPAGTLVFEAPTMAQKDFFTEIRNSNPGAMILSHGSKSGFKVALNAPNVLLGNPTYQDSNGTQMLSVPFTINPTLGNDDFSLRIS